MAHVNGTDYSAISPRNEQDMIIESTLASLVMIHILLESLRRHVNPKYWLRTGT